MTAPADRAIVAHHESLAADLCIFYEERLLRRLAAVIRQVRPRIVLTDSPDDYMEDHMNTARLAVTASFARGMPNFSTDPPVEPDPGDVAVYHARPHGLCDGLRRPVAPDLFVNTSPVQRVKRQALAAHASQKAWLDASQGMDSYLDAADDMARQEERMSQRFEFAEGWRRYLHLGLSSRDEDPLAATLGSLVTVARP